MKTLFFSIFISLSYLSHAQEPAKVDLSLPPDSSGSTGRVFTTIEVEPEFPGGDAAWRRYLGKNLTTIKNLPPGTYQVIVKFVVDKDGSIQDVAAETKYGFGLEQEAIRVIKKGPKWIPGKRNDEPVKSYKRQPITWVVREP